VTLSGTEGIEEQLAYIRDLVIAGLPGEWAVKDRFCTLDLTASGFHVLFRAEWIYRNETLRRHTENIEGVVWSKLNDPADLIEWENAWAGPVGEKDPPPRIFLPGLLEEDTVAIVAAHQDGKIVAGAVANRTDGVVGLSNFFAPTGDTRRFLAGCISCITGAFPDLPLVGYERDEDLVTFHSLGFEPVGPLRVWLKGVETRCYRSDQTSATVRRRGPTERLLSLLVQRDHGFCST
jgi:hypothetical protein